MFKENAKVLAIFWLLSTILFALVSSGSMPKSIGYFLGLLIPSIFPSIIIGGLACLIFKNIRSWRTFWIAGIIANISLAILSLIIRLYMNN